MTEHTYGKKKIHANTALASYINVVMVCLYHTYQNKSFLIKKAFFMIISIGYLLVASRFNCTLETFETIYSFL